MLFLVLLLALSVFGAIMLYSSSYVLAGSNKELGFDKAFFLKRQVEGLIAGSILFLIIQKIDYYRIKKFIPYVTLLSIVTLSLLFIPSLGSSVKGARRWFHAGPLTIQPSEFAKFALIAYFAYIADKKGETFGSRPADYLPATVVWCMMLLLIFMEPDYGMSVVLCCLFLSLIFVSGIALAPLAVFITAGTIAMGAMIVSSPYRMKRVTAFLSPQLYAKTSGYQVIQSLVGFSNGGFLGRGIGAGKQKFFYLPEVHTDYIFSVIGEETGFLGVFTIATIFLILFFLCMRISRRAPDLFGKYFAFGTGVSLALCAFLNMGVCLKIFPPKGMVLPLVSYGRSSVVAHMIAMGLVYKISKRGKERPTDESSDRWGWNRGARVPRVIDCGSD